MQDKGKKTCWSVAELLVTVAFSLTTQIYSQNAVRVQFLYLFVFVVNIPYKTRIIPGVECSLISYAQHTNPDTLTHLGANSIRYYPQAFAVHVCPSL